MESALVATTAPSSKRLTSTLSTLRTALTVKTRQQTVTTQEAAQKSQKTTTRSSTVSNESTAETHSLSTPDNRNQKGEVTYKEGARSDAKGTVEEGDFVLLSPDEASTNRDESLLNYKLGINIAKVKAITAVDQVFYCDLHYYMGTSWTGVWAPMLGKHDNKPLIESNYLVDNLLQDQQQCIARLETKKHKWTRIKLTKNDRQLIDCINKHNQRELSDDGWDTNTEETNDLSTSDSDSSFNVSGDE